MIPNDRQIQILAYLKEVGRASVKKLASKFYVSEMTIRRDLRELENGSCLKRYNGGAVYSSDYLSIPIESRLLLSSDEKRSLSEKTKKYLHDFETVFIDSSSTCEYIIPLLADCEGITVVTNSVQCLAEAAKHDIPCLIAGGRYFPRDKCTIGSDAEEYLRRINIDVGFFSTSALSDDGIISDSDEAQNSVRRAVLPNCERKVFLFTSAKLHKKATFTLCTADDADEVIIL